jgi:hypothetical protein
MCSWPLTTRTDPGAARAEAAAAVPERCWQRVQWQYSAPSSGASISKRTARQPHPPVMGSSTSEATPGRYRLRARVSRRRAGASNAA